MSAGKKPILGIISVLLGAYGLFQAYWVLFFYPLLGVFYMPMGFISLIFSLSVTIITIWLGRKSRREEKSKLGTAGMIIGIIALALFVLKIIFTFVR